MHSYLIIVLLKTHGPRKYPLLVQSLTYHNMNPIKCAWKNTTVCKIDKLILPVDQLNIILITQQ